MSGPKALAYMPFPLINDYNLAAEKREVCSASSPKPAQRDIEPLELFYMALGLDIAAAGSVDVSYQRGGDSIGKKTPLNQPIGKFYAEYNYANIYDALKQSFSPAFRAYFESKVGTYEDANTAKKIKQIKMILEMLKKSPAQMAAADRAKLELYFHALGLDIAAAGSVDVSYQRGGDSIGKKPPLNQPIGKFYAEYNYANIYDALKQSFSPAFRAYFESKVGTYEDANTAKKIKQIKMIQAMLGSVHPSFCFAIDKLNKTIPEKQETEITLTTKAGVFPADPVVEFPLNGTPNSDKVKLVGKPALSPDKKKMTIKIVAEAADKPYGLKISDPNSSLISDTLDNAISVTKGTRMQRAADVVHNKLKLEAKVGAGPAGFLAGPGQSSMPLANRAAAEKPNVVVGLRMAPKIIGRETEDGKPFKKNDKHEVTIPVTVDYAQAINKDARDATFASVKAGAIYRYNPKGLSPEAYLFYNFADNRLRYPNTYLPTGSSHRLTPGLALNIPIKNQLGVRVFTEAQQEWFNNDSTVLGYPFRGQSQASRSGAELIFNWSKLGDKKKAPYRPDLSLAFAGLAGRREFPDRMPGYQGSVYSPFWGVEGEAKADWKKSSLKPYVAVGGSYRSYEGWNPTSEVYARGGINIKQAGTFDVRVGHINNLTPYYAGQEGSKTSLNLTYSPPEKLGRWSAFYVSLGYDHYKDGQYNGYNQFSAIFGVDLAKLIFGPKSKVAPASELTADDYLREGGQATSPAAAIALYTRAIECEPNNARAYLARGLSLASNGNHTDAVKDYTIAINLYPEPRVVAAAYYGLAMSNDMLNNKDEALANYDEACRWNPEFLQKPGPNMTPTQAQQAHLLHVLMPRVDEKCEETAEPEKCKEEVNKKIKFWHKEEDVDREVAKYPKKEETPSAPPAPPKAPEKPTKTEKPAKEKKAPATPKADAAKAKKAVDELSR